MWWRENQFPGRKHGMDDKEIFTCLIWKRKINNNFSAITLISLSDSIMYKSLSFPEHPNHIRIRIISANPYKNDNHHIKCICQLIYPNRWNNWFSSRKHIAEHTLTIEHIFRECETILWIVEALVTIPMSSYEKTLFISHITTLHIELSVTRHQKCIRSDLKTFHNHITRHVSNLADQWLMCYVHCRYWIPSHAM